MTLADCQSNTESFLADRRRRNKKEMITAITYGALMVFLAVLGLWPLLTAATAGLAICRISAALAIWRHQNRLDTISASLEELPHSRLDRLLDSDISFLKSSTYRYALPLGLGLLVIGVAFWLHLHSFWLAGACMLMAVGVVLGSRRMNGRAISEMNRLREANVAMLD